jgi:hypothetical protein
MTCCGVDACATHKSCTNHPGHRCCNMWRNCSIELETGTIFISLHRLWFNKKDTTALLYNVTYPFTRDHLLSLNIVSQDPLEYANALKTKYTER